MQRSMIRIHIIHKQRQTHVQIIHKQKTKAVTSANDRPSFWGWGGGIDENININNKNKTKT